MNMTADQIAGPLRALAPTIIGIFVYLGVDSTTAGFLAAGVIAMATAAWSWWSNRAVAQAAQVAAQPGVHVVVGSTASAELRAAAADPAQPKIVEAK